MIGSGRTTGAILIVVGVVIFILALIFLGTGRGTLTSSGFVLGMALITIVLVLPLVGGGFYLMTRGRAEATEFAEVEKQTKILNMVLTQGKVRLAEVALALNEPRSTVDDQVRSLVGKGLFSGAINWQEGILYSRQASEMKANQKCPNCGGQLELAGKDVIKCPYCGSEVFLSK